MEPKEQDREEDLVATDEDLAWLDNGFDEKAREETRLRGLRAAIEATGTPKHWRPVDVDRVA